ncbi:Diguanylate cyclase /diguanylate cyclase/phosphodiesterase [Candidatus Nitrotoga sp. HW29]|uniref:putative bifunctional diguanylate cyclase/phosphodiesterase n=1 Tax=Candidatus Nitrotoga sp. HW29 TaxID=2886963 RepID=UPI001EF2D9D8|nr:EAL domain-containing protein [Candidatus Nitrotoga sp. HW29]CAH1904107.1 Diguanylate cyclase /diguanylate cyclase/phosphodiesterase [Candidatus Nitrotoga sp. HW29]
MIDSPLKILVIEDAPADFLLLVRNLQKNGVVAEWRCIGNDTELKDALQAKWDVVLTDFHVPGMDFRTTLLCIQVHYPALPVIMVSGSVGEETAVELLRLGIVDFILKDHLARLPNAIRRALVEANERQARQAAETALHKLAQAVEQSPEGIAITNLDAKIEYVNEAYLRITGYSREEVIGQNSSMLHSDKTPQSTYDALWTSMAEGKIWQGEFYNKRKDASEFIAHTIISPIRQSNGDITHYVEIKEDITEKKLAEAEIHRLAYYDTLTGLPNRALLLERMAQILAMNRRVGHHSALISFNIDCFKTVNDAGGQMLGDMLLKAVGERLIHNLREGDVVARIAGDEFGILLTNLALQQHSAAHLALHISEKIHVSLHEPFLLGDECINISVCLGIALFPESNEDSPLDILRRANTSLHHSKTKGSGQTAFFEGGLDRIAKQRFNIERELRQAITSGELRVFLQTQVDASGKTVGAEALVRWQHPQRGLIPPSAFIPIAEESNLIIDIDIWVFTEVCRLVAREDMAAYPIRIATNISPRHFRQSNFVDQIKRGVASTGADPTRLILEVTEGVVIDNINDVIAKMSELSLMGIHFSMDDFGTGYSSLSYLKRLPIHEIKIDKTFVQDMTTNANDASLVEIILSVAQHMHLKVVAEGVETPEQVMFLNQRGLVFHQGYLFGKPEPAEIWIAGIKE